MASIKRIFKDHIFNNSLWLIADSIVLTAFGFFFWTINARLYSPEQVGLASTLLASAELLGALSLIGFDVALIRYLAASKEKNAMVNSCFSLAGLMAFLIGSLFVLNINILYPKLILLKKNIFGILFVMFVLFGTLSSLMETVFIALRKSRLVFFKDMIFSVLKIVFTFFLVFLGAFGIFSSWMIAVAASFVIGLFFLEYKLRFEIHKSIVVKMMKFSLSNYLANFLSYAPGLILPLMITHFISPVATAYFYIAWMITTMLFIIPGSIAKSLLAANSAKNSIANLRKSAKFTFVLLVPAAIAVVLLSKYLLLLFGKGYSENAFMLLQILALSSMPYAFNILYITKKNLEHKIKHVVLANFAIAFGTLSLSYLFLNHGLIAVGLSWLATQVIAACFTSIALIKNG